MDANVLSDIYAVLPFVPAVYALALYLVGRSYVRTTIVVGLLVLATLAIFVGVEMHEALGSFASLARSIVWGGTWFGVPMIGMTFITLALRERPIIPRWAGLILLVAVAWGLNLLGMLIASGPTAFDLVNATG